MDFYKLLVAGLALEALWETCKMFWQQGKLNADRIGAVIIGIFLCVSAGIDFFSMVNVPLTVPYAGRVLSGLLISRGANFLHDLIAGIEGLSKNAR